MFVLFAATISDFDENMEEATDDNNGGEKIFPGVSGSFPSIGVNSFRAKIMIQTLSFFFKNAVGFCQRFLSCVFGDRSAQNTLVPHSSSDIGFISPDTRVFFVCKEVFRQTFAKIEHFRHHQQSRSDMA